MGRHSPSRKVHHQSLGTPWGSGERRRCCGLLVSDTCCGLTQPRAPWQDAPDTAFHRACMAEAWCKSASGCPFWCRDSFERVLAGRSFAFSVLLHTDTDSPMIDFSDGSSVLQVTVEPPRIATCGVSSLVWCTGLFEHAHASTSMSCLRIPQKRVTSTYVADQQTLVIKVLGPGMLPVNSLPCWCISWSVLRRCTPAVIHLSCWSFWQEA